MANHSLEELTLRLQLLISRQNEMSREIRELQQALQELDPRPVPQEESQRMPIPQENVPRPASAPGSKKIRDWEKFVGENLISKIGILIMVIGVGIGSKYAIDHEMVSPLTRILLGYALAGGLLGFALKLRRSYEAFSAVLLSGALAMSYFLTFAGYSFYGFFPKGFTFGVMVILTVCTVWAALRYSRPIIAHLGFVGAYAVPFLLSDGSGQPVYLFAYMAIINSGILFISFRRYWRSLYYAAFVFTWGIYMAWFLDRYHVADFPMAMLFLCLFFLLFYATFLAYKLVHQTPLVKSDLSLLLGNSFTFYAIGFVLLSDAYPTERGMGFFTLLNALLHFAVALLVRQIDAENKKLFALICGLGIVYMTLTVPVQLEGGWITLLWAGEALVLFGIGRTRQSSVYEKLSYPLIFLSFSSLVIGWLTRPEIGGEGTPFANVHFLVSLIFTGLMAAINRLSLLSPKPANRPWVAQLMKYSLPVILLAAAYGSVAMEIHGYWSRMPASSPLESLWVRERLEYLWMVNYTLFFLVVLAVINVRRLRSSELMYAHLVLVVGATGMVFFGFHVLTQLRDAYLDGQQIKVFLWMRYAVYLCSGVLILAIRPYFKDQALKPVIKTTFELLLSVTLLWAASSELMHWLDLTGFAQSDKLALSILWGAAALAWIALGMAQKKKAWRIGAIVLFGITLVKLFFYDISHLDSLSKTIVMVALGLLLLIISFLYNRYKQFLFGENRED